MEISDSKLHSSTILIKQQVGAGTETDTVINGGEKKSQIKAHTTKATQFLQRCRNSLQKR